MTCDHHTLEAIRIHRELASFFRLSSSIFPSRNTYDVMMTCDAPASRYCCAVSAVMPPPT